MRAEFDQNDLDPGYARVTLTREDSDTGFYEDGDGIAIGKYTGNTCEYLCAAGDGRWGGSPESLKLEKPPVVEEGSVSFELRPAYVDSLEGGTYEVRLVDAAGQVKAEAVMPAYDIAWSGLEHTGTLRDYREVEAEEAKKAAEEAAKKAAEEAARKAAEEAARAEAERKAAEEAAQADGAKASALAASIEAESLAAEEAAKAEAEKAAAASADAMNIPPLEAGTGEKKSGKGLIIAAAVVVALLAGGGAYFMMSGTGADQAAEQQQAEQAARAEAEKKAAEEAARAEEEKKAAEEAAKAEAEKKAAEEAAKAEAEKKAAEEAAKAEAAKKAAEEAAMRADAKGRVASFFAGERTPESAMKLAGELDADTVEQQDALFRLYYYAASADNPEGAQRYAECVDPSRPAWGTIGKDGAEAWYYYGKSPEGESARAALRQWAEQAAQKGDAQAAAWLREMK
ncbi:hypothetical protein [uncultured Mailhella sp.]|uniref:hypothetical protein n=1 Tax=uncultured Mailhella sp. TaxID=1981031 RepID=UPI0025D02D12|nr:hypothetical protein [uncultured Mailhella sp.]